MSDPYAAPGRAAGPRPRPYPSDPGPTGETRRDVDAALAARSELGPEYDDHIAAGLADRVEELVAYRTAELQHGTRQASDETDHERGMRKQQFVLGIISLGTAIPITAISALQVDPGLVGVAVSWTGIVAVNVAHALSGRRRRR